MVTIATTTPERLRYIIDAFFKLTDRVERIIFRNNLTQEELSLLDQYIAGLPKLAVPITKEEITEKAPKKEAAKVPAPPAVPPQIITRPAPELIIKRTPYPKWWNDEGIAKISLTSPGSQLVITARGDYSLYIATIVLTVSGECDIVFTFGQAGASGPMNLGGADEPRGIVVATGNSPTPCGSGSFMITATSDESVNIGGYVSYYLWKKEA